MHFEVYHFLSIQHFASTSGISLIFTSFWKPFQKKTFVSRRERTASDLKASKERLIALLCRTQTGDSMLRPIVIKKLFDPCILKDKDKNNLPAYFGSAIDRVVVTATWCTEWFNQCLILDEEVYFGKT